MKTQHTPTPWMIGEADNFTENMELDILYSIPDSDEGYEIIATCYAPSLIDNGDLTSNEAMKANAAFIVRAVNSHDALVEALEKMLKAFDLPEIETKNLADGSALLAARLAITKAKVS